MNNRNTLDDEDYEARHQDVVRRGDIANRNLRRKMADAQAEYERTHSSNKGSVAALPEQLYETNPFANLVSSDKKSATPKTSEKPVDEQLYEENPFAGIDINKESPSKKDLPFILRMALGIGADAQRPVKDVAKERFAGMGRGFTDVGEGIKQASLGVGEKTGMVDPGRYDEYTRQVDAERKLYEETPAGRNPVTQAVRSASSSAPMMAAFGPLGMEGGLLAKMLTGAATGAGLEGASFTPGNESKALNMVKGATIGAAIPGVPAIARELTPTSLISRLVGSELSPKELARNLEVTAGTQTGLGDVIGSPSLKYIQENVLSKVPFTGAEQSVKQTGKEILDRGENIVNKYLGANHHTEVSDKLGEALVKADTTQTKIKNELYKVVDDEADKSGFQLSLPNFSDKLREHANALVSGNYFDFEPKIKKLVTDISAGNNIRNLSVKEANIAASKLSRMANQYGQSADPGNRNAARVLGELSRSLKGDVKTEIKNSGNKTLINAFDTAEKNYGENFSDFLEKDLMKFTHGNKSPDDLLTAFLKTGKKTDKADQLEKLMNVIPEKDHDLVRSAYFSRAIEGPEDMKVVNPNKLRTLWTDLGDNQKKVLIPDAAERRQFDNYVMLVDKNQKAVNLMWNPQTGQVNSSIITAIMAMHPMMALKDIVVGRGTSKLLTSEDARKKVVDKIIKRKP